MLACESSKAPTTLSKLFEAWIAFNHLRLLQVGLLLSWVLAKRCNSSIQTESQRFQEFLKPTEYLLSNRFLRLPSLKPTENKPCTYLHLYTLFDCAHCGGGVRTVALALWIGCPQTRDLKRATT